MPSFHQMKTDAERALWLQKKLHDIANEVAPIVALREVLAPIVGSTGYGAITCLQGDVSQLQDIVKTFSMQEEQASAG